MDIERDSWSRGHEFESWDQILHSLYYTFICFVVLKRQKTTKRGRKIYCVYYGHSNPRIAKIESVTKICFSVQKHFTEKTVSRLQRDLNSGHRSRMQSHWPPPPSQRSPEIDFLSQESRDELPIICSDDLTQLAFEWTTTKKLKFIHKMLKASTQLTSTHLKS